MNIKERNGVIDQQSDIFRISGKVPTNQSSDPTTYWNMLNRPPIRSYLPGWVIQRLWDYAKSPRIANNPAKKFKLVNELLAPYGFKPLTSGTNRRTFYCEYDPGIVLKIGSDDVGIKDNLSEYNYTQYIVKPFCPKIFDVDGDGVIALMERGEPITEEDYRKTYYKDIFEIFMILLDRGYVIEDAGTNYYKNFGLRLGFGPIIWDFPYICKVDYHKLRCTHIDPISHQVCGGEIDYNYRKGMNELICTKCGVRYSAKYLEDKNPKELITPINQERGRIMGIINTNFKITIKRGDQVVARLYNDETRTQEPISREELVHTEHNDSVEAAKNNGIKLSPVVENSAVEMYNNIQRPEVPKKQNVEYSAKKEEPEKQASPNVMKVDANGNKSIVISKEKFMEIVKSGKKDVPSVKTVGPVGAFETYYKDNKRYTMYPSPLNNILLQWITNSEEKFGIDVANFLANKLEIEYISHQKWVKRREENRAKHQSRVAQSEARKEAAAEEKVETKAPQIEEQNKPKVIRKEEIIKQKLDTPLIGSQLEKDPVDIIIPPQNNTSEEKKDPESWMSRNQDQEVVVSDSKDDDKVTEEPVRTTGLFPMKPKTPEEIEAEEAKNNTETAVMGFPGVPVVETIRFKQEIPKIRNMIKARFDHFNLDIKNTDDQIKTMQNDIKEFCKEDICNIMGTNDSGIEVKVVRTADHRNTDCFKVDITNNQSPVLTTVLYPDNDGVDNLIKQDIGESEPEVTDKEILEFFDNIISEFDASSFSTVEDVKSGVQAFLFSKVADKYKDKITIARLFQMSNEYVDTKVKINPNESAEDNKETVESQL